jgi:aspartate aminotransferase
MSIDLTSTLGPNAARRPLSKLAQRIEPSEILTIAYEVRARIAKGEDILNLTVGDFSSREFPVPRVLSEGVQQAVRDGHTNYPPATGVLECRQAIVDMVERRLGLRYPLESCLVVGGARPAIAGTYLSLVDRGDGVVFGLPSWNNNYYSAITEAEPIELSTSPQRFFFPDPAHVEAHIDRARLVCLNSPQNPTGTVIPTDDLARIAELVVKENRRRDAAGRRPVVLMYDQVYQALTFEGVRHRTPVELVPEVAPYTVLVDGISKGYAATGLRVGWALGPSDLIAKMTAILAHVGCWAPRPEQVATAQLLNDDRALDAYLSEMRGGVHQRLSRLDDAIRAFKAQGWPVDCIRPQGAIYLSIQLDLAGKRTADGSVLRSDEDIRRYILEQAGIALVPFRCFGLREDTRWFRASVGVASIADCESVPVRLKRAFDQLS